MSPRQIDIYTIHLNAGDMLEFNLAAFGETLKLTALMVDPVGNALLRDAKMVSFSRVKSARTPIVSGSGQYTLFVANVFLSRDGKDIGGDSGGIGAYKLALNCALRDGTVIKPGDTVQPAAPTPVGGAAAQPVTVPSNGFPGLAPIDFSQADPSRIPRSGEVEDEIAPTATGPSVFTFEATDGQQINLTFMRLSGNLNLGLVVIDEANKVYFISSLVAASETNSLLTLPVGKYRIGVFKLDLVPPAAPETTVFAITLK